MIKTKADKSKGKIVLYQNRLEVRLVEDTIWLVQGQMAELFGTQRPAITKHLANIFKSGELNEISVCSILEHTAADGKTYKTRFYNLDAVISVGYRVNSSQATKFRIWATNVLRKHLVNGYTINEKRLKAKEEKIRELQQAVHLLGNILSLESVSDEAKGVIGIISEYTRALNILDNYDHQRLASPAGTKRSKFILTYENAKKIIEQIRQKFNDSPLVGKEKDQSFKSSLGAIYQTFGKKDVYPTIEEKAANLLYFVTKNHSFIDGNKRIAAALFVLFLQKNGILLRKDGSKRIDDNALVALTLMAASGKPSEKDIMIKVILNLLD
ncbi:MAG TPA: cytochrome C biogenesis protein CycH [Phycisphaerales bacterium]|nr:MAG: cytochrome C biogenesis protein CycH [Planctomycetes bacterium GWC2_45_44]HBG78202.1 cytochrome C biogenesis protein CycH [Phycisphaerales bacterium]